MRSFVALLAVVSTVAPSVAQAKEWKILPVVQGAVTQRFNRGVPTSQVDDDRTTITVTPLPMNRGRLSFAIAAFNKAPGNFNLGTESVEARLADGSAIRIFTKDDLVKQAKNRAMWAQIAMATAAGLGAAAAATSAGQHTYNSTMYTPHGVYRYTSTYVNQTERTLATAAATGAGVYGISAIQTGLDNLVANLGETILQTTTVDQGTGYGGNIVLDKIKVKPAKDGSYAPLTLNVTANGRTYPFTFNVSSK